MTKMKRCEDRIDKHLKGRVEDLKILLGREMEGIEEPHEDLGVLNEYGLCFDYVEPNTFEGQKEGYHRYQLSWGGPSGEFRFFVNEDKSVHRIEYWFLDWFDSASRVLDGDNKEWLENIYNWLRGLD